MPYLGDSYPDEWPDTDDRLVGLPIERFVSGHGPVGPHSALEEARDFIHELVGSLKAAVEEGKSAEQAAADTAASLTPHYGGWRSFERLEETLPAVYAKLA